MRWRMCAAAALVAGAGCGEEAPGLADAGPRPEPAEPCAFAADEPGARAAYVTRGADGAAAVYVVDVAAPERACEVYVGGEGVSASFTAAGAALVVVEPGAVRWVDLRGGQVGRTEVVRAGLDVALSPNRTWILFSRYVPQSDSMNEYVAALEPDGVGEPQFVDGLRLTEWWAPEADVLAVWGPPERELHWMRLGGERGVASRRVLHSSDHDVEAVAWSPDGARLAALLRRGNLSTRLSWWDIGPFGPGERHELPVPEGGDAGAPVWSPDGARLAYPVGDGAALERTLVVEVATGTTQTVERVGALSWSAPAVLVVDDAEGLWTADVDAGGEPALAVAPAEAGLPARVSPDGLGVAYAGAEGEVLYRLLTAPPGPPVELGLRSLSDARWAPDSQSLLLWRAGEPAALALATLDGSPPRELPAPPPLPAEDALVRWAPEASAVIVADAAGGAHLIDLAAAAPDAAPLSLPVAAGDRLDDWIWAPVTAP